MATKHRTVTDVPRFLLTRIPHTTTTLAVVVPKKPLSTSNRWQLQRQCTTAHSFQGVQGGRSIHTFTSTVSPSDSLIHYRPAKRPRRTTHSSTFSSPTAPSNAPPLRHNGVYALTFKTARRAFSSTRELQKSHHFDTLKFVQRLKSEGFNEAQALAMMNVLNSVIEESIQNLTRTMVLKEDAERSTYTQKVDFAKLRSELANADSSEIQLTRSSHERLASDLAKLSARLRDEIGRTQASVRLDLNLEKGRIREEANSQDMRIKETEARIEQEVASLRERVEAVKFSTLQWLMGVCTGTAALILGAWRLLM